MEEQLKSFFIFFSVLPEKKELPKYDIATEDAERPEESREDESLLQPPKSRERKPREPSVWMAVVRTFGPYYLLGGLYKLIYDLITFINPLVLR